MEAKQQSLFLWDFSKSFESERGTQWHRQMQTSLLSFLFQVQTFWQLSLVTSTHHNPTRLCNWLSGTLTTSKSKPLLLPASVALEFSASCCFFNGANADWSFLFSFLLLGLSYPASFPRVSCTDVFPVWLYSLQLSYPDGVLTNTMAKWHKQRARKQSGLKGVVLQILMPAWLSGL